MSDNLVTLATFGTPVEASIVRNLLQSEQIPAIVGDDASGGMACLCTAMGGVKLQVFDRDAERALAILESYEATPIADDEWKSYETDHKPQRENDEDDEGDSDREDRVESFSDDAVVRALYAATVALFLLPLPIQIYSCWLLLRIGRASAPLSAISRRRILAAFLLNSIGVVILLHYVRQMLLG